MGDASFEIALERVAPKASGGDVAEFAIAANPGVAAAPLREIASGGELSRVMLALARAASEGAGEEGGSSKSTLGVRRDRCRYRRSHRARRWRALAEPRQGTTDSVYHPSSPDCFACRPSFHREQGHLHRHYRRERRSACRARGRDRARANARRRGEGPGGEAPRPRVASRGVGAWAGRASRLAGTRGRAWLGPAVAPGWDPRVLVLVASHVPTQPNSPREPTASVTLGFNGYNPPAASNERAGLRGAVRAAARGWRTGTTGAQDEAARQALGGRRYRGDRPPRHRSGIGRGVDRGGREGRAELSRLHERVLPEPRSSTASRSRRVAARPARRFACSSRLATATR